MKKLRKHFGLLLLFFVLNPHPNLPAQSQFPCPTIPDSLVPLVQERDTLIDYGLAAYLGCLNNGCLQEACRVYQLPANFIGRIYVGTSPATQLNIMIWADCNFMRLDTCPTVGDIIFAPFVLFFEYPTNAQLVVCGPIGQEIDVFIKNAPTKDTLRAALVKVDTLCGALIAIEPPIPYEEDAVELIGLHDMNGNQLFSKPYGVPYVETRKSSRGKIFQKTVVSLY